MKAWFCVDFETFLEHGIAGSEILNSRFGLKNVRFVRLTVNSSTKTDLTINEIKVFGYVDSLLTVIEDLKTKQIPTGYKMLKSYPNPFNPETIIQYELQENNDVNLTVFNIGGQFVKELVNKNMNSGEHEIKWDGRNYASQEVSSGTYFASLELTNNAGQVIMDSIKILKVK